MRVGIINLVLIVALSTTIGCTKESDNKSASGKVSASATTADIQVAEELQIYFKAFENFIERKNLKISESRLAGLQEIVVEEPKEESGSVALGVVGICYEREFKGGDDSMKFKNRVAISPDRETLLALENVDNHTKKDVLNLVFFHEMGHCLGGLGHTDPDKPRGKLPVGIMDTYIPSAAIVKSIPWEDLEAEFADYWREENP